MIIDLEAPNGEVIWIPSDRTEGDSVVEQLARRVRSEHPLLGKEYEDLWQWSVDEPEAFWRVFAEFAGIEMGGNRRGLTRTADAMPATRWFPGRTINFAEHLLRSENEDALVAVAEDGTVREVSREELRTDVAGLAAYLRQIGVEPGDRVAAVLPNITEAVVGLLATASIGAIWSICAPEFGPGAVVSRFAQLEPKVLLATPGYVLGGRDRDRRKELVSIIKQVSSIERVVWVTSTTETPVPIVDPMSVAWEDAILPDQELEFTTLDFSHPLWVLFSSGTTGIPKGIVHSHGGALLEIMKMLLIHTDLRPGDRYLNVASTSWVLWNSLVSALGVGAVPVLMSGNPTYPTVERVWEVASETRVAALGVSAGFIHACAKANVAPAESNNLDKLRCVQVTGSPLSGDGYRWIYRAVGDIWVSSMSGGTDIASVFVGGVPTIPVRVGYIQAPALGVKVEAWDEAGNAATGKGELVVTAPMPSMPLCFWGDDERVRYEASYFSTYPGVWRHGDFVEFADEGILIHGRSDSTLNRQGLRLGTAEIYAVVEPLAEIEEALVIGAEIGADGYYMPLFVKLVEGVTHEEASDAIVRAIRANLSARYLPDAIVVVPAVPHTRTGKKLEIPVKRLIQGEPLESVVDLGAVDDPDLLRFYADFAARREI